MSTSNLIKKLSKSGNYQFNNDGTVTLDDPAFDSPQVVSFEKPREANIALGGQMLIASLFRDNHEKGKDRKLMSPEAKRETVFNA